MRTIKELITEMIKSAKECDEAQRTLEEQYGIRFCEGHSTREYKEYRIQFQVFSGIDSIIEAMGTEYEDIPEPEYSDLVRKTEVDGTGMIQLSNEGRFEGAEEVEE